MTESRKPPGLELTDEQIRELFVPVERYYNRDEGPDWGDENASYLGPGPVIVVRGDIDQLLVHLVYVATDEGTAVIRGWDLLEVRGPTITPPLVWDNGEATTLDAHPNQGYPIRIRPVEAKDWGEWGDFSTREEFADWAFAELRDENEETPPE